MVVRKPEGTGNCSLLAAKILYQTETATKNETPVSCNTTLNRTRSSSAADSIHFIEPDLMHPLK